MTHARRRLSGAWGRPLLRLALLLLIPLSSASAQFSEVMRDVRQGLRKASATMSTVEALTLVKARPGGGFQPDCDYASYLQTIQTANGKMKTWKQRDKADKVKGRWGWLPTADFLDMILGFSSVIAQGAILHQSRMSVPELIQQMCVTSVSQDQTRRQVALTREAYTKSDQAIVESASSLTLSPLAQSLEREAIQQNWTAYYSEVSAGRVVAGDSVWREADALLRRTQGEIEPMMKRMREIEEQLKAAESFVFTPRDPNGKCPGGVDDASATTTDPDGAGRGPDSFQGVPADKCLVSGERAMQVTPWLELIGTDAYRIRVLAQARLLQIRALELSSLTVQRRKERVAGGSGLILTF